MRTSSGVLRAAFALLAFVALAGLARAQTQSLPPKPAGYFTDQANVVDGATGLQINEQLAQFERDTSNQILVAIYPALPPDASPDQFSIDTFNSWHPGQKGKDNGAALFVYVNAHKMFIVTGRGLEGALPDATCNEIVTQVLRPAFREGNYTAGIQGAVNAMIAATKGEYKGTGQTDAESQSQDSGSGGLPVGIIVFIIILIVLSSIFRSGLGGMPMIYTGGGWGGGGFGGGGGGGGGGFSGFSGGGGSSAGGGAGGGW